MVKVREHHPMEEANAVEISEWANRVVSRFELHPDAVPALISASNAAQVALAPAEHSEASWANTACPYRTGLEMVEILAELRLDTPALQAALLYRSVREQRITLAAISEQFGGEVADLIQKVLRMAIINTVHNPKSKAAFGQDPTQQAVKVREMLVSIIDDLRVALIKLAERTCAIRALKTAPTEKQLRVAREIFDIYAPLAHRLGIGHLKWELEDLAFRYLEPDTYKKIAKLLDERRLERQRYIVDLVSLINDELKDAEIAGEVTGRAKHIYSIWRKMQRKDIGFSQVYDIRAVRILVPTVKDCYAVLGIVHGLWRHIPNEFDDYIAAPKENGYRSLHTAVIGPNRRVVEIQIRTKQMHEEAELGVCSHWRYKGTDVKHSADSYEKKIEWLRQVLEWHEELGGVDADMSLLRDSAQERVYVFTPEGHVVDLPEGATPLDFAYQIHTDVGHHCRGAKVNGKMLSLNTPLRTGDQVQIITAKQGGPSRDWLIPSFGFIHTNRSRAKIQQWFRKQNHDENAHAGKQMLEKVFARVGLKNVDLEGIPQRFNRVNVEGLYAAVGAGDVGVEQVVNVVQAEIRAREPAQVALPKVARNNKFKVGKTDVYIEGVGNLLTHRANCCGPVPGDAISGYVTQGRGVSVHRKDCGNLLRLQMEEPQRIIRVSWGSAPLEKYPAKIQLTTFDRSGLVLDIAKLVDRQGLFIQNFRSGAVDSKEGDITLVEFVVEVTDVEQLTVLINRLQQISNVIEVKRVFE